VAAHPPSLGPTRSRERGQATVETVGIMVAIAILLAATAAVLAGGITLPRPPDLIGAIAKVFGRDEPEGLRPGLDVPGAGGYVRADHGFITPETDPPIGQVFGAAANGAQRSMILLEAQAAFLDGFESGLAERANEFRRDPLSIVRGLRDAMLDVETATSAVPNAVSRTSGYVGSLARMNGRDALLRVYRDAGDWASGEAISLAFRGAGRGLAKAGRRRLPRGEVRDARAPDERAVLR
jgi:hypothetical protein